MGGYAIGTPHDGFIRPFAMKAWHNNSNAPWCPPESTGTRLDEERSRCLPCLFHRTKSFQLSSIFKKGLMPGGKAGVTGVPTLQMSPAPPEAPFLTRLQGRSTFAHDVGIHLDKTATCGTITW